MAIEMLRDGSQRKLCARVPEGVETVHRKGSGYVDRGRDQERDREEGEVGGKGGRVRGKGPWRGPVIPIPSGT